MHIVKICPTCHESISATPLVDIIVTYREGLDRTEIYEQGWHRECYPPVAACEAIQEAFAKGEIKFTRVRQADSDPYHPANVKLAAALAAVRGGE